MVSGFCVLGFKGLGCKGLRLRVGVSSLRLR